MAVGNCVLVPFPTMVLLFISKKIFTLNLINFSITPYNNHKHVLWSLHKKYESLKLFKIFLIDWNGDL